MYWCLHEQNTCTLEPFLIKITSDADTAIDKNVLNVPLAKLFGISDIN